MTDILLNITDEQLNSARVNIANPYGLTIHRSAIYAVIGENGAGKTTLANVILARCRYSSTRINAKKIEFSDIHSLTGCSDSYYQQRFEATMNDDMPTVDSLMSGRMSDKQWQSLCESLSLTDIRQKRVNFLSSGELRKFLIVNMMIDLPELLILDNPYIGLDAPSRTMLNTMLQRIAASGVALMLLLCNPSDIPEFSDVVLPVKDLQLQPAIHVDRDGIETLRSQMADIFAPLQLKQLPMTDNSVEPYDYAFRLNDVRVAYGKHVILEHVDWSVARGEHWALLGRNGSGKSTLLSLVCADNPQSYCNDISIFDRRRGTGETIWDIKKKIGYLSPEMHLYFRDASNTLAVVASGLREVAGFFRPLTEMQLQTARQWMSAFSISHLADRRFPTLSSGEQRMALLVRTLIKCPPLLILDEPLHGLDMARKRIVGKAVDLIASQNRTSLVYVSHYENEIPQCVNHRKLLVKHNKNTI